MCCKEPCGCGCKNPEQKREPHECTPEQIRECHGDQAQGHPCESQGAA